MALHLTRVAYACATPQAIPARQKRWLTTLPDGRAVMPLTTARAPRRAAELAGGSLYWIIKHTIVARQPIIGIDTDGQRPRILLAPDVIPVRATARRSHQGWRYLEAADAPPDLDAEDDLAALPPKLARELAAAGLL